MVLTGDSQQRAEKPRRAGAVAGGGAVGRTPATARSRDADGSRAAAATYQLPIIRLVTIRSIAATNPSMSSSVMDAVAGQVAPARRVPGRPTRRVGRTPKESGAGPPLAASFLMAVAHSAVIHP
jgi:hypothetical protein